ncbi:MAG TPA: choice-of-anchor D domain-containing protein [Ktedonobacterales bacterium]|nr:choice-of-anchor D domain-containing protein [Ktedonobacterales bacterium]
MGSQKKAPRVRQTVRGSFAAWQRAAVLCIIVFAGLGLSVGSAFVSGVPQVSAASNAIQIENTQPGDSTWDDFSANLSPTALSGYSSPISVNHGQTVNFYVTTTSATLTIDIYRMGWYGGTGARKMERLGTTFPGQQQPIPNPDPVTGIVVCNWQVTASLAVPSNWVTGVYLAKLTGSSGDKSFIFFNVRNDGGHEDFVFQTSVTTYEAYNTYGMTSLYNNTVNDPTYHYPHATKVSFDRPFNPGDSNGAGHFLWYEYPMLRWAEKNGFDMTYTTDIDTDLNTNPLTNHKAFFSVGHDEYWSKAMRDNVQAAINAGVNVGFFGANDVYWQVRFEPNAQGVPDRVMVGYKDFATINQAPGPDPQWNVNNSIVTTRFRDDPVNKPELALVGVMFLDENNTPDGRPYVVTNASNWVFANTGFVNGTSVPGIVGYEFDNSFTDPSTSPPAQYQQYHTYSPAGLQILSNSLVQGDNGAEIAQSTIYTAASGARIFAAGSIEFSWGLDNFGGRNTANAGIQQMTANIFYNFNGGTPPPPPPPPPPGTYLQDNFESGNLTQWNGPFGTGSAGVVTGPNVHNGTYSAQLIDPSGSNQLVTLTQNLVNSPGANTYTRLYFQVSNASATSTLASATDGSTPSNNSWVAIYDGGSHGIDVYFRTNTGSTVEFDSAPNLITANTWYGLQIQMNQATSGVGNVWLNGALQTNALTGKTGVSGNFTAATPINALTLWNEAAGTTIYYDDVIVSDHDNGTVNSGGSPPSFNPSSLSFGNQNIGSTSAAKTVTLTNASGATLHISAVSITGSDTGDFAKTADTCSGQAIAVNATCTASVTFSPTAVGSRNATLSFTDDGAGSPQSVTLSGTGVAVGPAVGFNPANLGFGNQNTGTTSAAKTVTVTNTGNATLHITSVTLTGTNAGDFAKSADTCTGATVAVNATCTVSVTFSPTDVGGRNAALSFTDDAAGSPQTFAVAGTGVAPAIGFNPTSLTYPSQGIGTTSGAQTISVINNGTAALHVTSVTMTGTNAGDFAKSADTCTGASVAPLAACSISVTFSPTATGARSATLSFADDVAGSPQTVALNGTGVTLAPGISFTPPSLTFANQGVGTTSAAQSITVTNTGNASLHVTSVTLTGTNAGDFAKSTDTCSGATVAANATCTVSVTFKPTAAGSRTASLSFADDAPGSPQSVALSGSGMQVGVYLQDGFESGNLSQWSAPAGTGSATVQTSVVNSGSDALAMTNGANQYVITSQSLTGGAQAHTFTRLYFRITNASASFSLASATDVNGNNLWAVVYDAGSHGFDVYFWNGARTRFDYYSSTNLIQANAWYSLEIELNEATAANGGAGNVWLNGNRLGGITGDLSATNNLSKLFLWNDAASATTYFDDVVVSNVYNGPLGSAAAIGFTPSSVSFGNQGVGTTSAAQTVTAKNTGTANLHMTTVVLTGTNSGDFAITANTCNSAVLAPNATCTVSVTFTPAIVGNRSASLSFTDDAPLSPQAVALTGNGATSGISFNPTSVSFGSQTVSTTSAAQTVTATNSSVVALHVTSVTLTGTNGGDFAITADTCTGATVAVGAACTVSVTFTPGATGARSALLSFVDDAPSSPQTVPLTGTGASAAPVVSFNPASLNYGNQNTGTTSAAKSVTVTNTGTAALHVTIVALAGANSGDFTITADTCTGASVAVNATCSASVTFTPGATGARSATLTFTDDAGGSPQTVALSGTGVAAGISFTPASLGFGNQGTGTTSAAQTVTVTNSGTAALHVTSVTLTGANAGDFAKSADTCSGATVAAGATCTVSVTFKPTATGARTASLSFADDAPSSPQTVAVSGTGTQIGVYLQDGFESGNLSQWGAPAGTGSATVENTVVNRGSNALAMTNGSNQYVILSQGLTGGAQAHTFTRLYFRITNASVSFSVASATDVNGNNLWAVVYDAGSHGLDVYFWNGARTRFDFYSATNLITANTWYSLEIELNEATAANGGAGNVWLNGNSLGGVTGDLSATNNLSKLFLWNDASSTTTYFDDVIVSNQYNGVLP